MIVTREQLEASLHDLRAEVRIPAQGLYGPQSLSWRVDREMGVFLAGGRAALMQLAHPYVGTAIAQHSDATQNPLARFQRTFDQVYAMVFGELDHALKAARRVHAVHSRIEGTLDEDAPPFAKGHRYRANEPQALLWVHATLVDSALLAYGCVLPPLSWRDKERYYRESSRFARLFGLSADMLQPSWQAFRRYVDDRCAQLTVTRAARAIGQALLRPPALRPEPLARWYRVMTTGLLPAPLQRGFGLPFGAAEQAIYRRSLRWLPRLYQRLPMRLRQAPGYADARWRLRGRAGRDPIAQRLEQLLLRAALGGT